MSDPLPQVLWFGNDWFAENRTSSHHVARGLSAHTCVTYFGCPGLRRPAVRSGHFRRAVLKSFRALTGTHRVGPSLAIKTLVQIPIHGSAAIAAVNGVATSWIITRAMRPGRSARPIVCCAVPHVWPLVRRIDYSLLVYYCIDDYAEMPGVDSEAVQRLDDALATAADVIIAASGPVFDRHRRAGRRVHLIPHGVDAKHFAPPDVAGERPVELRGISGPIVGFIGTVDERTDLPLINSLATSFPHATFVMVGRIAVPADDLPLAPNVRFIGPRPYEFLPAYGHCFDVAIMPYRRIPAVFAANPLKLREYLAMGLPVVSVPNPEVERYADLVAVAHDAHGFAAALDRALKAGTAPVDRAVRIAAVESESWSARISELVTVVRNSLALKNHGTAA